MSLFKRIAATVYAQLDDTVSRMENNDAVIQAAIQEAQRAAAKTKVRLAIVRAEGERMRERQRHLSEQENRWSERARRVAESDRDTALSCLAQRRACQTELQQLETSRKQHDALSQQLSQELQRIESKLQQINQQRTLMRTRESAADALNLMNTLEARGGIDIEQAFERWEVRVTEAEMRAGSHAGLEGDTLDQRFQDAEQQATLNAELDELLNQEERDETRHAD